MMPKQKSKTQQALDWISANPGETPYRAAAEHGIRPVTLYAAIARVRKMAEVPACPCCSQKVQSDVHLIDIAKAERERIARAVEETNKGQSDDEIADIVQQVANIIRSMK